jgi:uncharacterized protein YuzE
MTVTIGQVTFDSVHYDAGGDVLYLHVGDPTQAVDFDESPEGHALRFDAKGDLVGVTIVRPKWLIEHEGKVTITMPERLEVGPDALRAALAAA